MSSNDSYDFTHLQERLERAAIPLSPAEVHGLACGLAVTGLDGLEDLWHKVILEDADPDDVLVKEAITSLDGMLERTLDELEDESFGLVLCLPQGEVATVQLQAEALRDWCQGFLFGFGLGGEALHARLSQEAAEALQDMTEITRMDTDAIEDDEEGERSVAELEEYLRVVTLTIRQDVLAARQDDAQ